MKKNIAMLIISGMLFISTAFARATGNTVDKKVLNGFSKIFATASNVNWDKVSGYYKASFQLDGQYLYAFLSQAGQVISVARYVSTSQLPINLKAQLEKNYPGFWVSDLFEIATPGTSKYYITIENADQKIILQSLGMNEWTQFQKTKK